MQFGGTPTPEVHAVQEAPTVTVDQLPGVLASLGGDVSADFTGDKFYGGFGDTTHYTPDYWTLRERSRQLFKENLYARGIIRRYITNVVNTGLELEATPEESILGFGDDELAEWSENTENRFKLWGSNPTLCDFMGVNTFGKIQAIARREALIEGDVLVVLRPNKTTGLPTVQLVSASAVQTPAKTGRQSREIEHGVELDAAGRHVAFWIDQEDGTSKRLPAYDKTGRRVAWLVYGTDKMHGEVRGEPLLSIILQSLKEIDRYRDSAQRKAVVNSILAMFIKRETNTPGTLPVTGGATFNKDVKVSDSKGARTYQLSGMNPGLVAQGLAEGETPVQLGGNGTDVNFPIFEEAVVSAMAWAFEMPPEILKLAFSNNYSASQAAINEFKIFLNRERKDIGDTMCSPIYEDWCISEALMGTLNAPGFLIAWRDPRKFYQLAAWLSSDWSGAIKPSTDIKKQAQGYKLLVDEGWITNDRASKELTGTKYSKNIKKIKRENEAKAEADAVLLPPQPEPTGAVTAQFVADAVAEALEEFREGLEND
jgi:capsid protein